MKKEKQSGWNVVFATELRRLWLGWRGPLLLLVFSLVLSGFIVLLALDPELNVVSQRKMIAQTIQVTVLAGSITALLLGANAVSGERDQRSLESLLLTPATRWQIVVGKLLAVLSFWLGMIPIAIPYVWLAAKGTGLFAGALLLLILPGTLLVGLSAGIGIFVSSLAPNNLVSLAVSFAVMLLLAAPTQLPTSVQNLPFVRWLIVMDPITAVAGYQSTVLDGEAWTRSLGLLLSPLVVLFLLAVPGLRFLNRRLSLQGGMNS